MTAPTALHWPLPVEPATPPPLDRAALEDVKNKLAKWKPYDGDALLEDVSAVVDDVMPPEERLEELAERLRGHSMRLVHIAVATQAEHGNTKAADLIKRARAMRSREMPGDYRKAVGHVRLMAWSVNELHEHLGVIGCIKEEA
ncbi:DUF6415 family natural product biosynthesis protein [Streptomyces sp. SP18BB07]|uniref:DUF6415 family natural product biosynthesis protein n=1 Tax=Streptomyces sp. SP18BB07 TaxID=3002522 RepID=UPI002E762778|nr:DUF6415 family natural product biosynthesis protein [Streptomyces sp. SP18BB07]MEE1764389.1 DUF6415 family natural product biosynthesis protein [Streptomyces sp. SP18BB07]